MAKGFLSSAKTYAKNLGIQTGRVVKGQASLGDAGKQLGSDTNKLIRAASGGSSYHPESKELVDQARQLYNDKHYERAEEVFRMSLMFDDRNPWAFTYLGHTLYKLGRRNEALASWRRAIKVNPKSKAAEKARGQIDKLERKEAQVSSDLLARLSKGK